MNFYETLTPEKTGKIFNKIYKNWDRKQYQEYLKNSGSRRKKRLRLFQKACGKAVFGSCIVTPCKTVDLR